MYARRLSYPRHALHGTQTSVPMPTHTEYNTTNGYDDMGTIAILRNDLESVNRVRVPNNVVQLKRPIFLNPDKELVKFTGPLEREKPVPWEFVRLCRSIGSRRCLAFG